MRRLWKRLLVFVALPLAALAAGLTVLGWLAWRQFTPDAVQRQLEATCNARVQLDGCSLSLFSSPARLELVGLHFHPRDTEADRGTPQAGRPPVKIGNTYLRMRRGVVEADLAALLLRREIRVRTLTIEMGDVKYDLLPGGGNSLSTLFQRPATVAGKPNPALAALAPVVAAVAAATEPAAPAANAADSADSEPEDAAEPDSPIPALHARDLGALIAIDGLELIDARVRIRNRKTRAVTELNQLQLGIRNLSVDPARLSEAPPAEVFAKARVWVDGGRKNPGRLAELKVSLNGALQPFDPDTGRLQPHFKGHATIDRGATLRRLPALEKVEKNLSRARRAGLAIEPLATDVVLAAETMLLLRFQANQLTLTSPETLDFTDYALSLEAGSQLDIAAETHDVKAAWIASQAISDRALGGARDFLGSLGEDAAGELRRLLIDPVVKDGRLRMDFTSSGPLAKPEVRIAHPLTDVTDQIKDAGRSLLDTFKKD